MAGRRVWSGVASLVIVAGMGCATDPKITVTPFVLKPCVPTRSANIEPASDNVPATRGYEEAGISNVSSASTDTRSQDQTRLH